MLCCACVRPPFSDSSLVVRRLVGVRDVLVVSPALSAAMTSVSDPPRYIVLAHAVAAEPRGPLLVEACQRRYRGRGRAYTALRHR